MGQGIGLIIGILAQSLVLLGAWIAHKDGFFSVDEMRKRGIQHGLPFAGHAGMWGDAIAISPILGIATAGYCTQWSIGNILLSALVAFAASAALHFFVYVKGTLPGTHAEGGKLTRSGWVHLVYMGYAFTILILLYFFTKNVDHVFLVLVSIILPVHIWFGSLMNLDLMKQDWFPEKPLKSPFGWMSVAIVAVLVTIQTWRIW